MFLMFLALNKLAFGRDYFDTASEFSILSSVSINVLFIIFFSFYPLKAPFKLGLHKNFLWGSWHDILASCEHFKLYSCKNCIYKKFLSNWNLVKYINIYYKLSLIICFVTYWGSFVFILCITQHTSKCET